MTGLTPRFLIIAVLFVTCLIVSNITAVKLIDVAGYIIPGAIVIFPISYIIGDVLTEVYGFAKARTVIWLGFGANLFAVATFILVGVLPAAGFGNMAMPIKQSSARHRAFWRPPSLPI